MICGACDRDAVRFSRCESGRIYGACNRHIYRLKDWVETDNFHFNSLDDEEKVEARKLVEEEG